MVAQSNAARSARWHPLRARAGDTCGRAGTCRPPVSAPGGTAHALCKATPPLLRQGAVGRQWHRRVCALGGSALNGWSRGGRCARLTGSQIVWERRGLGGRQAFRPVARLRPPHWPGAATSGGPVVPRCPPSGGDCPHSAAVVRGRQQSILRGFHLEAPGSARAPPPQPNVRCTRAVCHHTKGIARLARAPTSQGAPGSFRSAVGGVRRIDGRQQFRLLAGGRSFQFSEPIGAAKRLFLSSGPPHAAVARAWPLLA